MCVVDRLYTAALFIFSPTAVVFADLNLLFLLFQIWFVI
jgi:hypothetical protein